MALDQKKYDMAHTDVLRDVRPMSRKILDALKEPSISGAILVCSAVGIVMDETVMMGADFILFFACLYVWWLVTRSREIAFKLPATAKWEDPHNSGGSGGGKASGILFLGNVENNEEIWFTNSDARTHVLYLGTTGSGKTEGLKSMVTNAMCWGSGFIYVDGKADTDLWSSLSSLARRFGREDDLLVLNYMTGNSDERAPSNTLNPFSSGSASYLTNMLVSLMPEAEGDNAMWKERAVSLLGSLMPVLTWKRDNQETPLSVSSIRKYMELEQIIKLSRDDSVPERLTESLKGYLQTLPGYVDEAFDDDGNEKPMAPDQPMMDTQVVRQQHGYLTMQFTRSLQSLGDDYGYIFDTQSADVDMVDVVLNRRILVTLIPALEKSSDETANLGKILVANLKGMMGSTLGATVEGSKETAIENKPTNSATPFMAVFDEVGYYTAPGMAVMAAQARSLGFSLVFAAQDLPALEKRVKEEARSITANCNIKIFGKLEDPTQTKEFFEKTVGQALVTEVSGYGVTPGSLSRSYLDGQQAGVQIRGRASYDELRSYKEGDAIVTFGETVRATKMFYANPGHAKAMRVQRFLILEPMDEGLLKHKNQLTRLRDKMVNKNWTAESADISDTHTEEVAVMNDGFVTARKEDSGFVEAGAMAIASLYALTNPVDAESVADKSSGGDDSAKPDMADKKKSLPAKVSDGDDSNPMSFFSAGDQDTAPATTTTNEDSDDDGTIDATPSNIGEQKSNQPMSWADIIGGAEDDDDDAEDEDGETSSGGGSSMINPEENGEYDSTKALENMSQTGKAILPTGLSPEVEDILKTAAKNISAGLFTKPTQGQSGDIKGPQSPRDSKPDAG